MDLTLVLLIYSILFYTWSVQHCPNTAILKWKELTMNNETLKIIKSIVLVC